MAAAMEARVAEWTLEAVAARFADASRTARRLPPARVQGYFNVWPPIVRSPWERLSQEDEPLRWGPPSPQDVERMLEVMRWVQWLEVEQRHLVWMRAEHYEWDQIGRRMGCCRQTAWRRWRAALTRIAVELDACGLSR
jgi:DNA-directed RNA polymerase specialized sigma24 family protein